MRMFEEDGCILKALWMGGEFLAAYQLSLAVLQKF